MGKASTTSCLCKPEPADMQTQAGSCFRVTADFFNPFPVFARRQALN